MENKSMENTQKRDIELLFEIGCLRYVPRSWKRFLNPDVANNSEHILRVTWIAWLISEYENVGNKDKILKMALLHDLTESRTGDVDYISRQYTKRKESEAINDIARNTIFDKELMTLWNEYEKRTTLEAKIVKDADNLDVELELVELESQGHSIGKLWNNQRKKLIYPRLYTDSAKKLWDKIHESNPHDWHLRSDNRFKSGDWKDKNN